jgi:hypothetical protein
LGYAGNCSIPKTGAIKAYATNPENAVLVIPDKKKVLLSPDKPVAFKGLTELGSVERKWANFAGYVRTLGHEKA